MDFSECRQPLRDSGISNLIVYTGADRALTLLINGGNMQRNQSGQSGVKIHQH